MTNTIKCPDCGKEIEIDKVLTHQIEEQVIGELQDKHKRELDNIRKISDEESSRRVGKLTSQIEELLDEKRILKAKAEDMEIEIKKKIMEAEDRIKLETKQKTEEEHKLKDFEKDKKLNDALTQIEILKNKIQQGSQQTQGESLELELETKLTAEFPMDKISEVKKGVRGADVNQIVVDKLGRTTGTILWESKNAKWSDGWISKLKEDARQAKADLLVLVTVQMPTGIENFIYRDGVWIVNWKNFLPLAWSLRFNLISLYHERQSQEGRDEKMKVIYNYLTGNEFRSRVEGIVEAFGNLQDELEKEKRYFNTKWARQEKEIRKVIDHTHGMYGDLQGVIGKSLPELEALKLDSG
jgi:hypothetical protein